MPNLVMLGRIGLVRPDGTELGALMRRPKHLALLAFLASPRPGTWHRRDTLLGVFWSGSDNGRARTALRSALHVLRQELGDVVLRTRGDGEVSLDPGQFGTDAALLEEAVVAGRHADALRLCEGELLPGLFVPDAEGFEKWLDAERVRLRGLVRRAAVGLVHECEGRGDLPGAVAAAERAVALNPDDEAVLRLLVQLLDRVGDRGRALAAYEAFRSRLAVEFGAEPSAETVRLVREIRARRAPAEPPAAAANDPELPAGSGNASLSGLSHRRVSAPRTRRGVVVPVALVLLAVITTAVRLWSIQSRQLVGAQKVLVVLPMENATGDPRLAYLATGLADGVARRLRGIGGFKAVRSAARADWPQAARTDIELLGREFGSEVALESRLTTTGDSLAVSAEVVDLKTGRIRSLSPQRFGARGLSEAESQIAASVAGALFRAPIPEMARRSAVPIRPESFRLTLEGWHALLNDRNDERAKELFLRAAAEDPTNARAWAGLSSAWSSIALGDWDIPFEQSYARAEAAANRALALDSMQGTAWANLGFLRAVDQANLAVGVAMIRRGIDVDPGNPELYMILAALYRRAWEWDKSEDAIRVARQLDPLSPYYAIFEARTALCADRPVEALRLYQAEYAVAPENREAWRGVSRSLARIGRYDEALGVMRRPPAGSDTSGVGMAMAAYGEQGYWQVVHSAGQRALAGALSQQGAASVPPARLGLLYLAAGRGDEGLTILEAELAAGNWRLRALPCWEEGDYYRGTARFQALLAKVESAKLR